MGSSIIPTPTISTNRSWTELGNSTATTATISFTSLAAYSFYRIRAYALTTGVKEIWLRFNNDSAANYAVLNAGQPNSATDFQVNVPSSSITRNEISINRTNTDASANVAFDIIIDNTSGLTTILDESWVANTGASSSLTVKGMWKTVAQINRIDILNSLGSTYNTNSGIFLYGSN